MGDRLPGDVDSVRAGALHERDALRGADVDDVQAAASIGRERHRAADRIELRNRWTRLEIGARVAPALGEGPLGQPGDERVVFGVDGDDRIELGRAAHAFEQGEIVGRAKVRHPGLAHERLEADRAAPVHRFELIEVPRHETAPEREVDPGGRGGGLHLALERLDVGCRRRGVQRHVDERRHPARGKRRRRGGKALPLGPARLVAVDVRVDPARQHMQPRGVDLLGRVAREVVSERRDLTVADRDVALTLTVGREHGPATDEQVVVQRYAAPASRSSVAASTRTPRSMSSAAVYSSGEWLIPPTLGTKIMPIGM